MQVTKRSGLPRLLKGKNTRRRKKGRHSTTPLDTPNTPLLSPSHLCPLCLAAPPEWFDAGFSKRSPNCPWVSQCACGFSISHGLPALPIWSVQWSFGQPTIAIWFEKGKGQPSLLPRKQGTHPFGSPSIPQLPHPHIPSYARKALPPPWASACLADWPRGKTAEGPLRGSPSEWRVWSVAAWELRRVLLLCAPLIRHGDKYASCLCL